MILSAQTIRSLCTPPKFVVTKPMIDPFIERQVINGKSAGLSSCSYDVRIDQDLIIWPGSAELASTIERFVIPEDVAGFVCDKSSYARKFISCFNTLLDPGWEGYLTLEIANLGANKARFQKGDPICQIVFHRLDRSTDRPYAGKYSDQGTGPQEAREER